MNIDQARSEWTFAPGVTYLNHGSFGPAPRMVLEARNRWFAELEANPMGFFTRRLDGLLADVRDALGRYLNAPAEGLILVDNATWAMNVVAASVQLEPGDEVLLTDHEYGAVKRIWELRCAQSQAQMIIQPLPVPLVSHDEIVERIFEAVTPRTKLLVFSHITSPTAVILPAEAICARARERGVSVCIDGPHAPLQIPVNIGQLDCDYYAASCHKWMCAPFGSGFLHVHKRVIDKIRPVVVSWGTRFPPRTAPSVHDEFTWVGTRDPSAWLAVPAAIEFFGSVGARAFRKYTHEFAQYARHKLEAVIGLPALVPDNAAWYGSMIAMPLPVCHGESLQQILHEQYGLETLVTTWNERHFMRPSCHLYTMREHIDALAAAMAEELPKVVS
jgi:isopenicillin-N epimerase